MDSFNIENQKQVALQHEESVSVLREFILKIIYTIDNEVSPFLSRSLGPVLVEHITGGRKNAEHSRANGSHHLQKRTNEDDDDSLSSMGFGNVNLSEVLKLISFNSPELFNSELSDNFQEYNVYYRDIIEEKEPYVSCGFLTALKDNMNGISVIGRVVKNFSDLVRSNGNCYDILEVKLKFSRVLNKTNIIIKKSPERTLISKSSPIHVVNMKEKKTESTAKKAKKRALSVAKHLSPVDLASQTIKHVTNSQKSGRSSIMRKIMEKDVLISSLKEQQFSNSNIVSNSNINYLDSSPGNSDFLLSSSITGLSTGTSSNLSSFYSSSSNNYNSNSNNISSLMNSNVIQTLRSNGEEAVAANSDEHEGTYSDVNKRFDFTKMKQKRSSSSSTTGDNIGNNKKVGKKKRVNKTKIQNIIKEKENLIPNIMANETNNVINTTTGISFDLGEILLDNYVMLSPPSTQRKELESCWNPPEEGTITARSKLSNEIFDSRPSQPPMDSSPHQKLVEEKDDDKNDSFFNDLKSMGIDLNESFNGMVPDGIINISAAEGSSFSGGVLDSDFFGNFEGKENNNVIEECDNNFYPGISSSPALS